MFREEKKLSLSLSHTHTFNEVVLVLAAPLMAIALLLHRCRALHMTSGCCGNQHTHTQTHTHAVNRAQLYKRSITYQLSKQQLPYGIKIIIYQRFALREITKWRDKRRSGVKDKNPWPVPVMMALTSLEYGPKYVQISSTAALASCYSQPFTGKVIHTEQCD